MSMQMRKLVEKILKNNEMTWDDFKEKGYIKISRKGFMDLNIDYLGKMGVWDQYAISHYFIQNGDSMADPDMQFIDDGVRFHPVTFQQDSLGIFQRAIDQTGENAFIKYVSLIRKLTIFVNQWAKNLKMQGFLKKKPQEEIKVIVRHE